MDMCRNPLKYIENQLHLLKITGEDDLTTPPPRGSWSWSGTPLPVVWISAWFTRPTHAGMRSMVVVVVIVVFVVAIVVATVNLIIASCL